MNALREFEEEGTTKGTEYKLSEKKQDPISISVGTGKAQRGPR